MRGILSLSNSFKAYQLIENRIQYETVITQVRRRLSPTLPVQQLAFFARPVDHAGKRFLVELRSECWHGASSKYVAASDCCDKAN